MAPPTAAQLEDDMQYISRTSLKLLRREPVTATEWRNLFTAVYNVTLWNENRREQIYLELQRHILSAIALQQAKIPTQCEPQVFLKAYTDEWRSFFLLCKHYPGPFEKLKQSINNEICYNVRNLMLDTWNASIFSNKKEHIHKSVMKLIEAERHGQTCDPQLIVAIRESYANLSSKPIDKLSVYREFFETAYFEDTRAFYRTNAQEYLRVNGVENYLKYAELRLGEEGKRAEKYLEPSSRPKLTEICGEVLVFPFKEVISAECGAMIKRNEIENLQRMFQLLTFATDCIPTMLGELEEYIIKAGLADMVAAAKTIVQNPEKYVQHLLDLFSRFSELVEKAFRNDPRFLTRRDKAFKTIINDTALFKLELATARLKSQAESKCPELLANYCDMLLRKTNLSKKLASEIVESRLKGVVLLLKYVENKDVFMIYFKSHLTRRLILETSADSHIEENMVEWLRDVGVPAEYLNKVRQMFQDVTVSGDLNRLYKEQHRGARDSINIKILNSAAWARNSGDKIPVSLPIELEDYICEMEDFYRRQHSGRKLIWHHQMSNGTITFVNAMGKFDLDVTTFQMAVLFAWNERPDERISFENLQLATELPDAELRKTIWSLVSLPMAKRNIVNCHPEVKSPLEFTNETQYWINDEFALFRNGKVQKRGKINLIGRLQLSTEKSKQVDNEDIVRLREWRLQEAIVRVAKARKTVAISQLQNELIGILKNMFLPTNRMIKQQVEWLIENNYLRRDEDLNSGILIYVA